MTFDGTDTTWTAAEAEPLPPATETPEARCLMRAERDEIDGSLCDVSQSQSLEAAAQRLFPLR